MSAEDVIAEALDAIPADARPATLVNRDRATAALAALKAAGYAVVVLPEPSYVDEPEGDGEKGYGFSDDPALSEHGVYAYQGRVFDQWDGWTPAQARTVASWWLAAANAAEPNRLSVHGEKP